MPVGGLDTDRRRVSVSAGVAPALVSGGATVVGALGLYGLGHPSRRALDAMLGGAAGVMLAAVSFALLVPALEGQGALGATGLALAMALGAGAIWALHRVLPHEHVLKGPEGRLAGPAARRTTLLVIAVALHNIPEGLAVGVGLANDPGGAGLALALGILVQNLPEGFAVAAALSAIGTCLAVGAAAVALMPVLLAGAAGAMLFVVSHEILPETHRHGNEEVATVGLVLGFAVMVVLDSAI